MAFDLEQFYQASALIERARLLRVRIQAANRGGVVRIDNNPDLDIPFTTGLEALWTMRSQDLMQQAKTILDALV